MADLHATSGRSVPAGPAIEVPRRPNWGRERPERRWLEIGLLSSFFVHGMILAIVLFAKRLPSPPAPPPPQEGVQMVFENGQKNPVAVPHPKNRFIEIPRGQANGTVEQPASRPTPPPSAPAQPAPEVSLSPYEQLPPAAADCAARPDPGAIQGTEAGKAAPAAGAQQQSLCPHGDPGFRAPHAEPRARPA